MQSETGARGVQPENVPAQDVLTVTPLPADSVLIPTEVRPGSDLSRTANDRNEGAPRAAFPPGSVERLDQRLLEMLTRREQNFDLGHGLGERARLDSQVEEQRMSLMFSMANDPTLPEYLSAKQLADEKFMTDLLAHDKHALSDYQKYIAVRRQYDHISGPVKEELEIRRKEAATIINGEAKGLFPNAAVPDFKVARLDERDKASAAYKSGTVLLKDSDLVPSVDGSLLSLRRLPGFDSIATPTAILTSHLVHEMRHGEQDGLLLRKYIDEVVGNDPAQRQLTTEEVGMVAQRFAKVGGAISPEIIQSINQQRNGIRLSVEDLDQADAIEASKLAKSEAAPSHRANTERIEVLERHLERLKLGPMFGRMWLDDSSYLNRMFAGKVPPEVEELAAQYQKGEELDDKRVVTTLEAALEKELKQARLVGRANYREYRRWRHEEESHKDHQSAEARLGLPNPEKLLIAIFGRNILTGEEVDDGDLNVTKVKVDGNVPVFEHFAQLAKSENDPILRSAYEATAEMIAEETGALSDEHVRQKLVGSLSHSASLEESGDDPDARLITEAYRKAAARLGRVNPVTGDLNELGTNEKEEGRGDRSVSEAPDAAEQRDAAREAARLAAGGDLRALGLASLDQTGLASETEAGMRQRMETRVQELYMSGRLSEEAKNPDVMRRELGITDEQLNRLELSERRRLADELKGKLLAYGIVADQLPSLVSAVFRSF
jgi:hypothetical protein